VPDDLSIMPLVFKFSSNSSKFSYILDLYRPCNGGAAKKDSDFSLTMQKSTEEAIPRFLVLVLGIVYWLMNKSPEYRYAVKNL
jgi:hypothetical protein